jgi:aspartate/methionine/tyrosine aminotransferase
MRATNGILGGFGTTIFTEMSALATEHSAINLGQGFPDWQPPEALRRAAARALISGSNQYPPMLGLPELRQAVALHERRFYGLAVDWQTEVMITSGATEALAAAFFGLVDAGDEVVLIEPAYDAYLPLVLRAGGRPVLVRLTPPHWTLPRQALTQAVTERTKLIVVNSPHNPTGSVLGDDDLAFLAALIARHDLYAVCDEVYEHLVFDGARHRPLMTLPGMRERTVRIGSIGKTFSATGWKVGTVVAAPPLIAAMAKAHQFLTFTTPPNLQVAAAAGLRLPDAYFADLAATMARQYGRLRDGLRAAGLRCLTAEGTYFLIAETASVGWQGSDRDFCRQLVREAGVAAVPLSAFYRDGDEQRFVRFCFCKGDAVIDAAVERLVQYFRGA